MLRRQFLSLLACVPFCGLARPQRSSPLVVSVSCGPPGWLVGFGDGSAATFPGPPRRSQISRLARVVGTRRTRAQIAALLSAD